MGKPSDRGKGVILITDYHADKYIENARNRENARKQVNEHPTPSEVVEDPYNEEYLESIRRTEVPKMVEEIMSVGQPKTEEEIREKHDSMALGWNVLVAPWIKGNPRYLTWEERLNRGEKEITDWVPVWREDAWSDKADTEESDLGD